MKLDRTPLHMRSVAHLDVAAASGIALRDGSLFVLADDELALARYDLEGRRTGEIALLPGVLPDGERERKAHKPDFEALVPLPDGSLLALGSGSTTSRYRGAWVVHVAQSPAESRLVDLSPLYAALLRELPELNIEGGAVLGDALYLSSRGNGARRENALIRIDWPGCARALEAAREVPADVMRGIERVQLGELDGQPLGFTDLASCSGMLLFTAAAEASPNTYDDGACAGSALGVLTPKGEVRELVMLAPVAKVEGVYATAAADAFELWLVADPDDRTARAPLMAAKYRPSSQAG